MQVALDGETVEQRGDVPSDAPPVPDEEGTTTVEIGGDSWRSYTVPGAGRTGACAPRC